MSKAPRKAAARKGQGTPVLSVRGVTRTYQSAAGPLTVLRGVDLDVMPGEVVGLIGPSGSGKSSLLHAAGLLERPTSGEVRIDGRDVGDLPERARTHIRLASIGFVYQFHHLLAEFDARDNVALPLRIAGVGQAEARARAAEVLTALGLGERLTHKPSKLSGGEQQRVAVARALANKPALILADEPTGNLDEGTADIVFAEFLRLVREEGSAALVATHNERIAAKMDRILRLHDGVIE